MPDGGRQRQSLLIHLALGRLSLQTLALWRGTSPAPPYRNIHIANKRDFWASFDSVVQPLSPPAPMPPSQACSHGGSWGNAPPPPICSAPPNQPCTPPQESASSDHLPALQACNHWISCGEGGWARWQAGPWACWVQLLLWEERRRKVGQLASENL